MSYKGGRIVQCGYIHIRKNNGYVAEHRDVVESFIGRKLLKTEVVHHKDGDKTNNRIENLELMNRADHAREHMGESHPIWGYWSGKRQSAQLVSRRIASRAGYKHSARTKAKIRAGLKGHAVPLSVRKKIRKTLMGNQNWRGHNAKEVMDAKVQ